MENWENKTTERLETLDLKYKIASSLGWFYKFFNRDKDILIKS